MEQFDRFARLTDQFLHGTLDKLEVAYNHDDTMTLHLSYQDPHHYRFDYEITLQMSRHDIAYATHVLDSRLNRIELGREQAFEQAICATLFAPVIA
jgi:hypothetical protein